MKIKRKQSLFRNMYACEICMHVNERLYLLNFRVTQCTSLSTEMFYTYMLLSGSFQEIIPL